MRLFVLSAISFTIFLGVGLGIEHVLDEKHYNPGFYDYPLTIGLHVALGGSYLGLALLQFVSRIRNQLHIVHRNVGRIALSLGLVSAFTALTAIVLFPFSAPARVLFVAPFAGYFGFALIRGYRLARNGDYDKHREWMIRAVAMAIAIQRLILVPALLPFGTEPRWASMISFTAYSPYMDVFANFGSIGPAKRKKARCPMTPNQFLSRNSVFWTETNPLCMNFRRNRWGVGGRGLSAPCRLGDLSEHSRWTTKITRMTLDGGWEFSP